MKNFFFLPFCYFSSCLLQLLCLYLHLYLHLFCTIRSGHAKEHKVARMVKGIWEKECMEWGESKRVLMGKSSSVVILSWKFWSAAIPECLSIILENWLNFNQKNVGTQSSVLFTQKHRNCKLPASSRMLKWTFPIYFWALERCHYQNEEMRS